LKNYISGEANRRYIYEGKREEGYGWAGQVAGRIKDIPTVAELFSQIKKEAASVQQKLNNLF
jgi:NADH:quinone reductase (non-electrogenic)